MNAVIALCFVVCILAIAGAIIQEVKHMSQKFSELTNSITSLEAHRDANLAKLASLEADNAALRSAAPVDDTAEIAALKSRVDAVSVSLTGESPAPVPVAEPVDPTPPAAA